MKNYDKYCSVDQLISETIARTGVFVGEGGLDDQDGFEENGSNEKDHDTASKPWHLYSFSPHWQSCNL